MSLGRKLTCEAVRSSRTVDLRRWAQLSPCSEALSTQSLDIWGKVDRNDVVKMTEEIWNLTREGRLATYQDGIPTLLGVAGFVGDCSSAPLQEVLPYVAKVNELLIGQIGNLPNKDLVEAANVYLGINPRFRGVPIGKREEAVATLIGRGVRTAQRRRKEVCDLLAWQMVHSMLGQNV